MDEWEQYSKPASPQAASGDDWEQYASGKQTSTAEAAGSGALQGLSFGFGDEAIGALQGALDPNKTIGESIESNRERRKILEREHPIASVAGDVAGSLLPTAVSIAGSVASAGAATPVAVATGAKTAASIGLLGAKLGLKAAAKKGAETVVKKGFEGAIKTAAKETPVLAEKIGMDAIGKIAKKVPAQTLNAALTGAAAGVGYSDAVGSDDPEAAMRAVASAGLGAGMGVVGMKLLPIVGKAAKWVKGKGASQIISGVSDVDEEAVRYLMNPATRAKMATTKTMPVIGQEMVDEAANVVNKIRQQSGEAFKVLEQSAEKASPYEIDNVFKSASDALKKKNIGGTYDPAISALDDMGARVMERYKITDASAKSVPLDEMKNLLWELDDRVAWDSSKLSPAEKIQNEAYKAVRKNIDEIIKTKSPEYGKLMEDIAEKTQAMQKFRQTYHNNPEQIGNALSKYMQAERKGVQQSQKHELLDTLVKYSDKKDFLDEAKAVWARDQFNKQVGKGSTNTNAGIMIGASTIGTALMAVGIPAPVAIALGGAIGGVFGKIYNNYGAKMTKLMLEKYIEGSAAPSPLRAPMQEFTRALQAIPDSATRRTIVNALLQNRSMDEAAKQEQMKVTPQGVQHAFNQVAR